MSGKRNVSVCRGHELANALCAPVVLMYGVPAWQSRLAETRLEQLERCQIRALCVISGQLQATLVETLRREVGVCSMTTLMRLQTVIAYEKADF